MAVIKPFKGIRFNQSLVKNSGELITPPYDVINPDEQERLHRLNPYNIIRLEYGMVRDDDDDNENRYSRAASTLRDWIDQGILSSETRSGYYLYEQSFNYRGRSYNRRGIFAALRLEPYSEKIILPHELTMSGPKADRMALLSGLRTNVSPIFTLFPDQEKAMDQFFSVVIDQKPLISTTEASGQKHRIWLIDDPLLCDDLTAYLEPQPLLIADGHHRYETALSYSQETGQGDSAGSGYILAALVSMNDPDLLMLPTHRLLSGLLNEQKDLLNRLINDHFSIAFRSDPGLLDQESYLAELQKLSSEKNGFGYITSEQVCLLVPGAAADQDSLSVSLLHDLLLKPVLQQEEGREAVKKTLSFSHDFQSTFDLVMTAKADAAFILDTVPVNDVLDRAMKGMIMPQKSTYFYPKLPSGLILRHLDLS